MSTVFNFPEGASFQFSNTLGTLRTITALTNANPPVATATAHGLATNDIALLSSGWEDLSDAIYRVTTITPDTFSLQGVNATDATLFPAGAGIGTVRAVTNWRSIPNVLSISTQGGDARFATVQPLARRQPINIPIGFNATSITLNVAHAPSNTVYQDLLAISRTYGQCGFRLLMASGPQVLGWGFLTIPETPQLSSGQASQVAVTFSLNGRAMSYA